MSSIIKSKKQYEFALEKIYNLMQKDLKIGSKEANELDSLAILVEDYENRHFSEAFVDTESNDPKGTPDSVWDSRLRGNDFLINI
ncbi:MAG TPA: hypothetical protein VHP32_04655 [Ignavibacteria bacterium]|nr:hypothetical protein [Ignavibacteria bacterium]